MRFVFKPGRENDITALKLKCNNIESAIDTLNCVVKDLNMTLLSSSKLMSEQRKESTGRLTSVQTVPILDMVHRNFQEIKMKLPMLTVRFLILMIGHLEIIFQLFNRKWGPYDEDSIAVCNNHKLENFIKILVSKHKRSRF